MKIVIIDDRYDERADRFRGNIIKSDIDSKIAGANLAITFHETIIPNKQLTPNDFAKIPKPELVDLRSADLLLIHGANSHAGAFIQYWNQEISIPIVIYRGGNPVHVEDDTLLFENKSKFQLSNPGLLFSAQQVVKNAADLNLIDALKYRIDHPTDLKEFFLIIAGQPKQLRLSLQLLHNALSPESIDQQILVNGKISEKNEIVSLISTAVRTSVEEQLNALRKEPVMSGKYTEGLRKLQKTLLPSLFY